MKLTYKNYEIDVFDEPNYTLNSVDNFRQYEKVYFEEKHQEDRFYPTSKRAIIVKEFDDEISSAIVCEVCTETGINEKSLIIEDDKIWICICNKIYCLEIPKLELIWTKINPEKPDTIPVQISKFKDKSMQWEMIFNKDTIQMELKKENP